MAYFINHIQHIYICKKLKKYAHRHVVRTLTISLKLKQCQAHRHIFVCSCGYVYIHKKHIYIFSVCVFRPCSFGVCFTRGALNDNSNNKIMLFGYTQIYLPMYMYVMLNAFEEVIHKLFK